MAAFSSADQLGRRPAPVDTSMRRARSRIGVSSEIDMCRSSKSAPNFTPHAWLRKALPRRRLRCKTDHGEKGPDEQADESHHGAKDPVEALPNIDHEIAEGPQGAGRG